MNKFKKYLPIIFTFFIMFEGNSVHLTLQPPRPGRIYKFNSTHELIGGGYSYNNLSLSLSTFINSYYRRTVALKGNCMFGNIGMAFSRVTGYEEHSFIAYPVSEFSYENVKLEMGFLPNLQNNSYTFVLFKSVVF